VELKVAGSKQRHIWSFDQVSEFRRTIGENIAASRRVGKSGGGLSLPLALSHEGAINQFVQAAFNFQ
jgi:hypothetical protein